MKKEHIEIKIKGKNSTTEHILFHYDRYYLEKKQFKIPQCYYYDQIASERVLDNIIQYMENNYDIFIQSITSLGYIKNDSQFFDKIAYTNNIMNKFILTSSNTQFTSFFTRYNEEHKNEIKGGIVINCALLTYPYIEMKQKYEKSIKETQQDSQLLSQSSLILMPSTLINVTEKTKQQCFVLRDELSMISDRIKTLDMKLSLENTKTTQEKQSYQQKKLKLKEQLKIEEDQNKKLLRMIHDASTQKKMLEQQKSNLKESFNEILNKEVTKKLKDYQDMLRIQHRNEITKLEQTYNFDISQRKRIAQEITELKNNNQSIQFSIDNTQQVIRDILTREKEKIKEYQELRQEIKLCSQTDQQNDILNCKFCNERPASIIFRPCGHLLYCENCWIDYLTDERDPFVNYTKYMCLVCLEFRTICKTEGFSEKID